jgi:hypothetical protein
MLTGVDRNGNVGNVWTAQRLSLASTFRLCFYKELNHR